jgi:PAT family beta-lactamase induction signal transducer AmpG
MSIDMSIGRQSWGQSLAALRHPRVITMLFLGFSAGIPILLIFGTLSLWLREAGFERSTITFFSWAALGYSFKFVWAPLVDKIPLPGLTARLGRRRAWLLVAQLAVAAAILAMAFNDPQSNLTITALAAVALGFSAATQDIVIDAYRIESAPQDLQAMMSSSYIAGYRIAMLSAGAGALYLASVFGGEGAYIYRGWMVAYVAMAACMLVGIATTLIIKEPDVTRRAETAFADPRANLRFLGVFLAAASTFAACFLLFNQPIDTLKTVLVSGLGPVLSGFLAELFRLSISIAGAGGVAWGLVKLGAAPRQMIIEGYVEPLADFVRRYGKQALLILALISLYRISDVVMGVIANVFYSDLGFTKAEIALYSKTYGLFAVIGGSIFGGVLAMRYGVMRILFTGAVLAAASNILFAFVAIQEANAPLLIAVIVADNMSAGIASAAFVAYLSGLTSVSFTAMQYSLYTSLMTLAPKLIGGYSGSMVDSLGYPVFFILTALMGLPVLFLIVSISRKPLA